MALPGQGQGLSPLPLVLTGTGQVLKGGKALAPCPPWLAWPVLSKIYHTVPGTSRICLHNAKPAPVVLRPPNHLAGAAALLQET